MHNLKLIRENINQYKKKFQDRYLKVDFDNLISLDKENRELIQKKEKLEQEKKIISKKKDNKQFEKSKEISKQIESLEDSQRKLKQQIDPILNFLPNVALDDVPVGKDEKSNKELKKVGKIPEFNFKTQSHYEIGKKLNLMDFNLATKT